MTEREPSALEAYVQRVMALKEERDAALSDDELRSVALEIGLSEEDLAAVEQAAADHHLRGQGFLVHRRWDDAVAELEEAVAVTPRRVERLHDLAEAHAGRWLERGELVDRSRAEMLARQCLEIDPHHGASFGLLDRLDSGQADEEEKPSAPSARGTSRKTLVWGAAAAVVLIAIVVSSKLRQEDPAAPLPAAPAVEMEAPGAGAEARELDVPATLDSGATGVDLGLDVRHSRLVTYGSGQSFYTLNAILTNRGDTELDTVGMRLEMLDEAGAVIEQDSFEAINKAAPVLRPGDTQALHRLRETSWGVRQARLVVETVDQSPAAGIYAPAKKLTFDWQPPPSPDVGIALRERSYRFSENTLSGDGSGYFDVVIEVENTGERTIRGLELSAEIVGPEERWVVHERSYVAVASGPAMHPGEVRLARFIEKVEGRPDSYRLSVVQAR